MIDSQSTFGDPSIRCHRLLPIIPGFVLGMLLYEVALGLAQERPTLLAGHGTLSGSILPLWVGAEAELFEKYGLQIKPIYLPRAAGGQALLSGDIEIYFSAGPPLVQIVWAARMWWSLIVRCTSSPRKSWWRRRFKKLPTSWQSFGGG